MTALATSALEATRAAIADRLDPRLWTRVEHGDDGEAWRAADLLVIWSIACEDDDRLWLHVSVSRSNRLPSYSDMTRIKALFVGDERAAYTVMPAASKHVNIHPNCLHLWAVAEGEEPMPDFSRGMGSI